MHLSCLCIYFSNVLNSFNKTEAAVFSCRLCFLRAFPFISLHNNFEERITIICVAFWRSADDNRVPFNCLFTSGNILKSTWAKSGEYAGWFCNLNPRRSISSKVDAALWCGALSWCKITEVMSTPGLFLRNAWVKSRRRTWNLCHFKTRISTSSFSKVHVCYNICIFRCFVFLIQAVVLRTIWCNWCKKLP